MESTKKDVQAWAKLELERVNKLFDTTTTEERHVEWNQIREKLISYIDGERMSAYNALNAEYTTDRTPTIELLQQGACNIVRINHRVEADIQDNGAKNRLQSIAMMAWMKQLRDARPVTIVQGVEQAVRTNFNLTSLTYYLENYSSYKTLLEDIVATQATTEYLQNAYAKWNDFYRENKPKETVKNKNSAPISELITKKLLAGVDENNIEKQILVWQAQIENSVVARTWGWEVEAPNPGDVKTPMGVDKGSDGSLYSEEATPDECECDCGDCTYHECDCDDCDNQNDDPSHCRDEYCMSNVSYEFRTVGGLIVSKHPGLKQLLDQIVDTEKNVSAGTHIHVYAADLTAVEVATVLAGYAITQRVWDVIAGRSVDNDSRCKTYANRIPGSEISLTLKDKNNLRHVGKFYAVNTYNVNTERGTLEFRQMDCNFDFDRITFMAWMVRGLVEVVKRGAKIHEFMPIVDIEGFIKLYGKYGFTGIKETDEIQHPVGSRYNQKPVRYNTI
jgi:hypothetical protein